MVRTNPVDDIALGWRIKRAGLCWWIVDTGEFVSCRMYPGFWAAVEGFTKGLFAVFGFRLVEYFFVWAFMGLVTWEPLIVLGIRFLGSFFLFCCLACDPGDIGDGCSLGNRNSPPAISSLPG